MADNNTLNGMDSTPTLTLNPEGMNEASQALSGLTLEPTLTLSQSTEAQAAQTAADKQAQREANAVKLDEEMLTDEEKRIVEEFSQKIDITDSNQVMTYGSAAQKNIANFSESALKSVKTQDLGEIGEDLAALVVELKNMDQEEKKGLFGFIQKKRETLRL